MSLASSPDCLFRPEDKALKMLFPSVEDSNSFDDFFNGELYDRENADSDDDFLNSTANLFPSSDTYNDKRVHLTSIGPPVHDRSPPEPWRRGLWCLNNKNNPELKVGKTRKPDTGLGKQGITVQLAENKSATTQNLQTHCSVRGYEETKKLTTGPNKVASMYNSHSSRPAIHREVTLSPSPMYASLPDQTRLQVEAWQKDFQNFHLRAQNEQLIVNHRQLATEPYQVNPRVTSENAGIGVAISTEGEEARPAYQSAIDPSLLDPNHVERGSETMLSAPELVQKHNQEYTMDHPPLPIWTTESLHSSEDSHHSYETHAHSTNSGFSEHSIHTPPRQPHWPAAAAYGLPPHITPFEYQAMLAAPKPQRVPHHILHHSADHPSQGLGIHYPELDQMNQAVFHEPQIYHYYQHMSPGVALPYSPTAVAVPHTMSYPPLPPPPMYTFSNESPFTPRKERQPPSRSPSPPLSPTAAPTRTLRQRSPTRTDYNNHHRRKSINKSGPIKDASSAPPVPAIDAAAYSRPKSRSRSKPPRTPRTPRTPRSPSKSASATPKAFATIDFVNFTSKDSLKLLSDVAPSGSSKTKARREAEAKENRKRLNEAALRAVRDAGGDERRLRGII